MAAPYSRPENRARKRNEGWPGGDGPAARSLYRNSVGRGGGRFRVPSWTSVCRTTPHLSNRCCRYMPSLVAMDLRQLAALVAVAETGTFSAAADVLHTVQSNVSTHVA